MKKLLPLFTLFTLGLTARAGDTGLIGRAMSDSTINACVQAAKQPNTQILSSVDTTGICFVSGETKAVTMHDGSKILLKKVDEKTHDPTDRLAAIRLLEEAREKQLFITGLIYIDTSRQNLAEHEHLGATPLALQPQAKTRPSRASLDKIMEGMF